ncbi:hypothetical protein [Sphingomonas sp.]|uniref:hypothetical protein n=1 Tax=Sphingomonas sp. TaxID=28214 RepID=UPI003CC51789
MHEATDLIERLLTAAGMIMEDAAAVALVRSEQPIEARLHQVGQAAQDVTRLTEVAELLHRRWLDAQA